MSCKFSGGVEYNILVHHAQFTNPTERWRIFVLTHEVSIDTQEDKDHSFWVKMQRWGRFSVASFWDEAHDKTRDEDMDKKQESSKEAKKD